MFGTTLTNQDTGLQATRILAKTRSYLGTSEYTSIYRPTSAVAPGHAVAKYGATHASPVPRSRRV